MDSLYDSNDCNKWKAALGCYDDVVKLVAAYKKRGKAKESKDEGLEASDKWFQRDLPELVASRECPHLTHDELAKLMSWKLMRGRFRLRLTQLVQQNPPEEVESSTHKAFTALPKLREAIQLLSSRLKGVGPATASAVLCAMSPTGDVPFMADECVQAIPGLTLDYKLQHYLAYAEKIRDKTMELNKQDGGKKWTCHEVELALWSHHFASKLKPALLAVPPAGPKSDHTPSKSDSDEGTPPRKKYKHS